jgi:MYXO-CTERM domain-containing protein
MFALDAFGPGKPVVRALEDFLVHVAPVLVLLLVVVLSWRWEWVGGGVFTACALFYAYATRSHPAWIPVVSGPLLLVGVLFLWSWRHRRRTRLA